MDTKLLAVLLKKMRTLTKTQLIVLFILVTSYLIYVLVWSYITVLKFYSLDAAVYDLGAFMQAFWLTFHTHSVRNYINGLFLWGDVYIFSPLVFFNSYPLMLIVQSSMLGLGVFPIYGISKHFLKSDLSSIAISLSYLIYFPLAGPNWFDWHPDVMFIPFFLFGYYFYLKNKYPPSFFFFILSGLGKYPEIILVLGFAVFTLLEKHFQAGTIKHIELSSNYKFLISLGLFSLIFFMLSYISGVSTPTVTTVSGTITENLDTKIFTMLLILGPVVMLPVFAKKWFILMVPYFYLLFRTNYSLPSYIFPGFISRQYVSIVIPFVFIGAIEGLAKISGTQIFGFQKWYKELGLTGKRKVLKLRPLQQSEKVAIVILITTMLFASIYEPYGPLNQFSQADFNLPSELEPNMTLYQELVTVANIIPKNDPYVLIDNQEPEALPRPQVSGAPLLIAGYSVSYNMSYQNSNRHWEKPRIDYVFMYTEGWGFTQSNTFPYNGTAYEMTQRLWASGNYGIVAEASGIVLLERNYSGPIKLYVPIQTNYNAKSLTLGSNSYEIGNSIAITDVRSAPDVFQQIWGGPFAFLPPGRYQVTFQLETTNDSVNNRANLIISDYINGLTTLNTVSYKVINGSDFSKINTSSNITMDFNLSSFGGDIEFRGDQANWNGTLILKGISLRQIGPPQTESGQDHLRNLSLKEPPVRGMQLKTPSNTVIFWNITDNEAVSNLEGNYSGFDIRVDEIPVY